MELKKIGLTLFTLLNLSILAPAHADILVQSHSLKNEDLCSNVAGKWTGKGTVSLGLTCGYKGTVDIEKTKSAAITMKVHLDKESGSFICPDKEDLPLEGICENGTIKIKTSAAQLDGSLSDEGHKAHVTGTVTYLIFHLATIIDLVK